jgi:hypothetical protein
MIEFLHPSVSSTIIDNSTSFVTAQGLTQLFVAFTADKGEDNKIQKITTASEWFFHYGEPNIKKHGQAAYNAINWLNSGGGIYALRVTPENAGYAHAIVNIQTKESTKKVLDKDDNLVTVKNTFLRPTVAYTEVNNISVLDLEKELSKEDRGLSLDGYKNNFLLCIYPKGRGKAYGNLGFRLRLNDSYDESYPFRVYNFEVTQTNTSGSVQVIEGPFQVSLDPEAVSISEESMYIVDVVQKNSQHVNIIFNESAYDEIGAAINESVHPKVLDFFSGSTRSINGELETYYDATTKKEEDVHISLRHYDMRGELTAKSNIVDSDDFVERNLLTIDRDFRMSQYNRLLASVSNKKLALSRFRSGATAYNDEVSNVADIDDSYNILGGDLKDILDTIDVDMTEFSNAETNLQVSQGSDEAAQRLENSIAKLREDFTFATSTLAKVLDYVTAVKQDEQSFNALVYLRDIESSIQSLEMTLIKLSSMRSDLIDSEAVLSVTKAISNPSEDEKLTAALDLLTFAGDTLDIIRSLDVVSEDEAQTYVDLSENFYADAVSHYENATDSYSLADEQKKSLDDLLNVLENLLSSLKDTCRFISLEVAVKTVKSVEGVIDLATSATANALVSSRNYVLAATTPELRKSVEGVIKESIDSTILEADSESRNIYVVRPQNYNNYAQLDGGSDGDLDDSNTALKTSTTKNLLIQAYNGFIDPDITNKKEYLVDMVLDANYPVDVKNAISSFCSEIRKDCVAFLDTGFQANPEQALEVRRNSLQMSTMYTSIFAQDFVVYDEFTGKDIKVTTPYYLASKVPLLDNSPGMSYPMAGPRRGTFSGFKKLSYNPSPIWKEQLYRKQVNYVEQDSERTNLATQLTSQTVVSATSHINNVRTLLRILREVENLSETHKMEFNDDQTLQSFQENLNILLDKWRNNRAVKNVIGTVYASDYDREQNILRVRVEISFTSIIERIMIDMIVEK